MKIQQLFTLKRIMTEFKFRTLEYLSNIYLSDSYIFLCYGKCNKQFHTYIFLCTLYEVKITSFEWCKFIRLLFFIDGCHFSCFIASSSAESTKLEPTQKASSRPKGKLALPDIKTLDPSLKQIYLSV